MAAFLHDPPVVQHDNSIHGADRGETVGDHDGRAIAQRLIRAAAQICAPGAAKTQATLYQVDDVSCAAGVWYESNPPKRMLTFRVDDTVYEMLVSVSL